MKRFDTKTKLIGDYPYFCDENGNVYAMGYDIGTYGYKIVTLEGDKEKEIKNPTNEQRLYALLNYIWIDNLTNHCKTGIYQKMDEQVIDEFNWFLSDINTMNFRTKSIFARFGLNPSGEIQQGALNGLVKDIVLENKKTAKESDLEYVFRNETPVSPVALRSAEKDGKIYVVKPDYANYGFKIYDIDGNKVEEPQQYQKENALLNLVLADNVSNPSKTGLYCLDSDMIEDAVEKEIHYIKNGKCEADKMLKDFGLYYSGELMSSAVDGLVNSIKAKEEENLF